MSEKPPFGLDMVAWRKPLPEKGGLIFFSLITRGTGIFSGSRKDAPVLRPHLRGYLVHKIMERVNRRGAVSDLIHSMHPRLPDAQPALPG